MNENAGIEKLENKHSYVITIQGRLDESWTDWFGGLNLEIEDGGEMLPTTTLTGVVVDQVALRGILTRVWDLNLSLISVSRVEINSDIERA